MPQALQLLCLVSKAFVAMVTCHVICARLACDIWPLTQKINTNFNQRRGREWLMVYYYFPSVEYCRYFKFLALYFISGRHAVSLYLLWLWHHPEAQVCSLPWVWSLSRGIQTVKFYFSHTSTIQLFNDVQWWDIGTFHIHIICLFVYWRALIRHAWFYTTLNTISPVFCSGSHSWWT